MTEATLGLHYRYVLLAWQRVENFVNCLLQNFKSYVSDTNPHFSFFAQKKLVHDPELLWQPSLQFTVPTLRLPHPGAYRHRIFANLALGVNNVLLKSFALSQLCLCPSQFQ